MNRYTPSNVSSMSATVTSLPVFIQNILNSFPKRNEDLRIRNDMG